MTQSSKVYSSKNVIVLSSMFLGILFMLYLIGVHLQERKKIDDEIRAIQMQNQRHEEEIAYKERQIEYLESPQRKYKEAKMQLGKKLPGEKSITFIQKKLDILPESEFVKEIQSPPKEIEPINNWQWLLLR